MSVLWKLRDATVAEIRDGLADDLAYPTVQTILHILEGKGFVEHVQDGRAFRFRPTVARDAAADSAVHRIIAKMYHGSRELLVNRLLADEDISDEELQRIQAVIRRRIEENGR